MLHMMRDGVRLANWPNGQGVLADAAIDRAAIMIPT